jgi:hypothetical protein
MLPTIGDLNYTAFNSANCWEETKMSADNGKVIVTDIKIPFRSMVVLMVKWAVATIPALIILILIGSITFGILNALMGGGRMGMWWM